MDERRQEGQVERRSVDQGAPDGVERRGGMDRKLSNEDHRVMLEAERKRWEADMDASEKVELNVPWAKYEAGLKEVDAIADTDPVQAIRMEKAIKDSLEEAVKSIIAKRTNELDLTQTK